MSSGGFELRKWACSHPEVIANLPENLKASKNFHSFNDDDSSSQKILGLFWDLNEDTFQVRAISADNISTKRQLLSIIARIFDPLGFISPSTIILKIILQDLWKANLDWDDQIPPEIHTRWNKFQAEIEYFKKIKIPRYIHIQSASTFQIHGFCDASPVAYAAVIYIRILSDTPRVFLITSKTRVAPVKQVTLPRLELCGAVLLSELIDILKSSLNIQTQDTYLWCDSTIALCWINNPPQKGNQFVLHRVRKILSSTNKESWHHVPGKENPADWATRGLYPKQLQENAEWIHGPQWLHDFDPLTLSSAQYTSQTDELFPTIDPNSSKDSVCLIQQVNKALDFINEFSSYLKLIRTVAWIFRFANNLKSTTKNSGPLNSFEINHSIHTIAKLLQEIEYSTEILLLKNSKPLPKSSKLISLNPFIDVEGIMRVGGRLRHQQDLSFDEKHPILIPKNHHFTRLIIQHFHKINFHAGQDLVLCLIRQLFWIPDGKSTVRKELRKCIDCFKFYARPTPQLMGDLPSSRIHPCRAYEQVGIDFAGPITTKCQHARKPTLFKSYICLFICMCTKAVHLELVSSLSTSSFLASLRRFVSRRGYPSDIYSDNGTNFVGAAAYLKSLFKLPHDSTIQDYSSQRNIRWHFIPPHSPNFGGLWEASIKLTKSHLIKTCKAAVFNFEELTTLLCQIEACINSRPLCPVSPDPKDLRVLTPGHFVIGGPLLEIPENMSNHSSTSFHSRWNQIIKSKENFWKRWKVSYLHHLQSRAKWRNARKPLEVGTLVLIPDASPHNHGSILGRVVATYPGDDGLVRVASIHTAKGTFKRATSQLAVLPEQDLASSSAAPEDVG